MPFAQCSLLLTKGRPGSCNSDALEHVGIGRDEMEQFTEKPRIFKKLVNLLVLKTPLLLVH